MVAPFIPLLEVEALAFQVVGHAFVEAVQQVDDLGSSLGHQASPVLSQEE